MFYVIPMKIFLKIPIIVGIMPLAVIIICYDLDDNNDDDT